MASHCWFLPLLAHVFINPTLSSPENLAFKLPHKRDGVQGSTQLYRRQQGVPTPTSTTQAYCYDADGLSYVNPSGSTFQIQCDTSYTGTVISTTRSDNFTDCIASCLDGVCVGTTYGNIGDDNMAGTCTLYSGITGTSDALDPLGYSDSALMTKHADETAVAAPVQVTTSTSKTISTTSTTSTTSTSLTTDTDQTLMLTSSTTIEEEDGIIMTTTTTTTIHTTSSTSDAHTSSSSIKNNLGTTSTYSTSGSGQAAGMQATFTAVIAYTEYRVQLAEICGMKSMSCLSTTTTATKIHHSTALSCSPGFCTGFPAASMSICIMPS